MSHNPYENNPAPSWQAQAPYEAGPTPQHVMAPAVALIAVGVIDFLQATYGLGRNLLGLNANRPPPPNVQNNPELMELRDALLPYQEIINITGNMLAFLCAIVIILAGIQMTRRKMYPLCITGSILAAIPCLSFLACCLVGEGVGIWAVVVLLLPDVKQSFGAQSPGAGGANHLR